MTLGTGGSRSIGGAPTGGSGGARSTLPLGTGGINTTPDASAVPVEVQTLANDVHQASVLAQNAGGPLMCSAMIPPVLVATDADVESAVVAYASAIVGVSVSDIAIDAPQICDTNASAPCANIFQNDLGHFGGQMANTTYALAQRIDSSASHVGVTILTPTKDGIALQAVVVLAGIQDGWLVSIATFAERLQCE